MDIFSAVLIVSVFLIFCQFQKEEAQDAAVKRKKKKIDVQMVRSIFGYTLKLPKGHSVYEKLNGRIQIVD